MCRLLLALNNNQTLNINLFSWSSLFQYIDLENLVVHAWRTQLELMWKSYDRVGRVVHGVVI